MHCPLQVRGHRRRRSVDHQGSRPPCPPLPATPMFCSTEVDRAHRRTDPDGVETPRWIVAAEDSFVLRGADCGPDLRGDQPRILMLPEPQHLPAQGFKRSVCLPVPLHVARQFRRPVVHVALRSGSVRGTRVPETAIDEHGNSGTREYQVGSRTQFWRKSEVDPVTKPGGVDEPSNGEFRRGISTTISLHRPPRRFTRCPRPLHDERSYVVCSAGWCPPPHRCSEHCRSRRGEQSGDHVAEFLIRQGP